jgi:hypothetical protein
MKKLLLVFGFAALALAVPLTLVTPGCTAPQQRIAVNTLFSTHTAVDGAFSSYMSLVLAGKVATNGVPGAAAAYRAFQVEYNLAVQTVAGNTNAAAPVSVTTAAAKVLTATATH